MASFSDRIRLVFDVDTVGGVSSIRKLRTEVSSADGVIGKAKAGVSGLGGVLKENMAAAALAAGTALVAFGKQSVDAFNDAALAAGKFSDTTAVSVEDASKWIALADDYGISADSIQGSMVRMSKAIGTNADALKDYGVEIAKADDGTVDANQTFINAVTTIGKIKDPTERAAAAQKTFGKSYSEVSRLMAMDAKDLKAALDATSDSQIIDESELQKARDYQAAMDDLGDIIVDLKMEFGEALVPAIVQAADALKTISDFADFATGGGGLAKLYDWANNIFNPLTRLKSISDGLGITNQELEGKISDTAFSVKDLENAADDASPALQGMSKDVRDDRDALIEASRETRAFNDALKEILGTLDAEDAFANFQEKLYEYKALGAEPSAQATRDFTRELANMIAGLKGVPEETKTRLLTELADGDIASVEGYLWKWGQGVTVPVRFVGQGSVGFMKNARGTPPGGSPGGLTLVGEEGPELVNMPKGAVVTPAAETARLLSGNGSGGNSSGGSTVVNQYFPAGASPRDVKAADRRYRRTQGPT